jgi:hypothetical protein
VAPQKKKPVLFPPQRPPADLLLMFDRVELEVAILVDGRGHPMAVPIHRLPRDPRPAPGDLIRVPLGEVRRPLWHAATVEPAQERGPR